MTLHEILEGEVLNQQLRLSTAEFAARARVHDTLVVDLVDSGVLEPQGRRPADWLFTGDDLYRLRCVVRLIHDLNVNLDGAAIILDLLEERQRMRAHLQVLEGLVDRG